jgi:hypothetical protein
MDANYESFFNSLDGSSSNFFPHPPPPPPPLSDVDLLFQQFINYEENTSIHSVPSLSGMSYQNPSSTPSLSASLDSIPAILSNSVYFPPHSHSIAPTLLAMLRAVAKCPRPAPASRDQFCRFFPGVKEVLKYIIDMTLSLVYWRNEIIVLSEREEDLHNLFVQETTRAALAIIEQEVSKDHSFYEDATGTFWHFYDNCY